MSIRLSCLECGHAMDLSDAYEDYEGEVRCWGCRTVMGVTLREGKLKGMRRAGTGGGGPPPRPAESPEPLEPAAGPTAAAPENQ